MGIKEDSASLVMSAALIQVDNYISYNKTINDSCINLNLYFDIILGYLMVQILQKDYFSLMIFSKSIFSKATQNTNTNDSSCTFSGGSIFKTKVSM